MTQESCIRKHIRVVGALVRREGRVMLTRRPPGRAQALRWEFPGGKVNPEESDAGALARELEEELGLSVTVGAHFQTVEHAYPDFDITLAVYLCDAGDQEPACIDVAEIAWVSPGEVADYDLTPPDVPVAARLRLEAASRLAGSGDQAMPGISEAS